jgi:hypothetical protein
MAEGFDITELGDAERRSHEALVEAHGRGRVDRLFSTTLETVRHLRGRGFAGEDIRRELGRHLHDALVEAGGGAAVYARRSMTLRAMAGQAIGLTRGTTAIFDDDD